jgi:hypothetical protein
MKERTVVTLRLLNKYLSLAFIFLSVVLIMSSCVPANTGNNVVETRITATPTQKAVVTTPTATCSQATCEPSGSNLPPFVDTWANIHLFQSFDYGISDPATVAKDYDFVWGAAPAKLAAWQSNPTILLSYYISFFRDSGTFGSSDNLQSLSYWKSVHPDWILYQCDRTTPAYEDGESAVPFDFTNPAVIAWQLQTYAIPASQQGYGALAADNVNMQNLVGACGHYDKNGQWVQLFSGDQTDPRWSAAVLTWIKNMQQALHNLAHPLKLIPNLGIGSMSLSDPTLQQVIAHVDGVLDERGFTGYGHGDLSGSYWAQMVQFIENVQQAGKAYYIVNEVPALTNSNIEWALASYLMCKEHVAAVAISGPQQYGVVLYNNWYAATIGTPRDAMYQGQGVYWRDYTHALVVVNPSSTASYTIKLPGQFTDLNGNSVPQTLTMPPLSGQILLF